MSGSRSCGLLRSSYALADDTVLQTDEYSIFANRESRMIHNMLKPQDLVLVAWHATWRRDTWTYQELSVDLALSVSEVRAAAKRARQARLLVDRHPVKSSLLALLKSALRHVYLAHTG